MKASKIILILGFFSVNIFAQERTDSASESITIPELRDHLFYFASDELQGRMIGTTGYDKAAEYAATQFRQAEIKPFFKTDSSFSYFQTFKIAEYSPDPDNNIVIRQGNDEHHFRFEDNFILAYSMGQVETKKISGKLAFAGAGMVEPKYGIDDFKNIDVKGKWVIITAPPEDLPLVIKKKLPPDLLEKYEKDLPFKRKKVIGNISNAGAIGIICISHKEFYSGLKNRKESFHNIMALTEDEKNSKDSLIYPLYYAFTLPVIYIDSSMTDLLFKKENFDPYIFDKKSYSSFLLKNSELIFNKEYSLKSFLKTENIAGLIEGSDPVLKNEYIVLSAHLDHVGTKSGQVMNGADDNSSGSAGVLEIGETLAKSSPKRSIICILFFGEEQGCLGSNHFLLKSPVPIEKIVANVNIDMIGSSNDNSKGIIPGCDENLSYGVKKIIIETGNKYKNIPVDWNYKMTAKLYSDHGSFLARNIPAVWFFDNQLQTLHTPMDDAETINYNFLCNNCRFIYAATLELANADKLK